jgi:hypothetical protein
MRKIQQVGIPEKGAWRRPSAENTLAAAARNTGSSMSSTAPSA